MLLRLPKLNDIDELEEVKISDNIARKADYLMGIYFQLKKSYTGEEHYKPYSENSVQFKCFVKLAERLERNLDTSSHYYIQAHFIIFGADTYPNHLTCKYSWGWYNDYLLQVCAEEIKYTDDEQKEIEIELLDYLSVARKESKTEIKRLFQGLFNYV